MRPSVTTRYSFSVEAELHVPPIEADNRAGLYYMPQCDMRAYDEAEKVMPEAEAKLRKMRKAKKLAYDKFDVATMIDRRGDKIFAVFSSTGTKIDG